MNDAYFEDDFEDISFMDLNPYGLAKLNEVLKSDEKTYYFSLTNGLLD